VRSASVTLATSVAFGWPTRGTLVAPLSWRRRQRSCGPPRRRRHL